MKVSLIINHFLMICTLVSCSSIHVVNKHQSSSKDGFHEITQSTAAEKSTHTASLAQKNSAKTSLKKEPTKADLAKEEGISAEEKPKTRPYKTLFRENSKEILTYCKKIDSYFAKYKWGKSQCDKFSWHHVRNSFLGNPIPWFVFGDEDQLENKNITLIMCGVHGDEITPVKFCYDLMMDVKNNPQVIGSNILIVAPLVAPDSFLKRRPTRTNARGVDINRNFPTKDWGEKALALWRNRYGADKRRYPGRYALSEQETIFSVNLINRYRPQKIISVHAPLTLLDYDGPSFKNEDGKAAKELLMEMSEKAGRYKVSNYPFFTGSLGNWAGNERSIPTYTLELPNSDWHKTKKYYEMFRQALHYAIDNKLKVQRSE